MNPHFQQLVIEAAQNGPPVNFDDKKRPSKFKQWKDKRRNRILLLQHIKSGILIVLGILSAGFGLESFLLPSRFIDGGATGISLLLTEVTDQPLYVIIVLVNIPFIIMAYRQMGKLFTLKTILAIIGLAICLAFLPYPDVTSDKLLVAVFGGFFLGAGIGFAMRGGAVLDGTEVLAIVLSRKVNMSIGDVIMVINVIIFGVAVKLLGVEPALYSMLTYLAASKTVNFLIEGLEEYTGVTIISPKNEEIGKMITEKLGRGITLYSGKGGFGKKGRHDRETEIIYIVITRLEISRLNSEIDLIDPNAFVVMHSIKDTKGGMIKKRPMKE